MATEDKSTTTSPPLGEGASCFSQFMMTYLTPVLKIAGERPLENSDLGSIPAEADADAVSARFNAIWEQEQREAENKQKDPSMWTTLRITVGSGRLLFAGVMLFVSSAIGLATPMIARFLIQFLEGTLPLTLTQKVALVAAQFLAPLVGGFLQAHHNRIMLEASVVVKTALSVSIYRKALRLSSSAQDDTSTGQIVNIMSNDTQRFGQFMVSFWPMCAAPLQLALGFYLIYREIGPAMFTGFGLFLVFLPLAASLMLYVTKLFRAAYVAADGRVKLITDVLSGIRVIKFYAWEHPFTAKIRAARAKELAAVRRLAYASALGFNLVFMSMPALMNALIICMYPVITGRFSATAVWTTLQLMVVIQQPLTVAPRALNMYVQANLALQRSGSFLRQPELKPADGSVREREVAAPAGESAVKVVDGEFRWAPPPKVEQPAAKKQKKQRKKKRGKGSGSDAEGKGSENAAAVTPVGEDGESKQGGEETKKEGDEKAPFALHGVNVDVKAGELVAVVGSVGCGKSTLLMSILGETLTTAGTVRTRGRVAFFPQQAWIQNATLSENVLFGTDHDSERYNTAVDTCALRVDIDNMPNGDSTEIGERGINLSGGQKARVSLARAVYADADIYLLDDPLAAVDAHVGEHIFTQCIKGVLASKTRILVTNQLQYLSQTDRVIFMSEGRVEEVGTYAQLVAAGGAFAHLMAGYEEGQAAGEGEGEEGKDGEGEGEGGAVGGGGGPPKRMRQVSGGGDASGTLMTLEEKSTGKVSWSVYRYYLAAAGKLSVLMVALAFGNQAVNILNFFWLAQWLGEAKSAPGAVLSRERFLFNVGVYLLLFLLGLVVVIVSALATAAVRVKIAGVLHQRLVDAVAQAPVSFFDVTPLGRVLNRFSKDINSVDYMLMIMIQWALMMAGSLFFMCLAVAVSTGGVMLLVLLPCAAVYYLIFRTIRAGLVDAQRLESVASSPVFASFAESLVGLPTIRAYAQQERFTAVNSRMLNSSHVPYRLLRLFSIWLALRLQLIASTITGATAAAVVFVPLPFIAGFGSIAITLSANITQLMQALVQIAASAEAQMNSVERIKYYVDNIPKEAPHVIADTEPDADWPSKGALSIQQLDVRYRDGPRVLRRLTLDIRPREKVGVVGRTGAGKSTLMTALFRIVEPCGGTILLDGVDIARLGLRTLRGRLGIIPQDPVMFNDTVRYNLDPFGDFSDAQLWEVLRSTRLHPLVSGLEGELTHKVSEGGKNFSVGQRQLICMARVLLLKPRLLVLDEATASLDQETDAVLQKMIRESFADCTVLTIAHRLGTIMDSDRILVMEQGEVGEFDSPLALLDKQGGLFRAMAESNGPQMAAHLRALATGEAAAEEAAAEAANAADADAVDADAAAEGDADAAADAASDVGVSTDAEKGVSA